MCTVDISLCWLKPDNISTRKILFHSLPLSNIPELVRLSPLEERTIQIYPFSIIIVAEELTENGHSESHVTKKDKQRKQEGQQRKQGKEKSNKPINKIKNEEEEIENGERVREEEAGKAICAGSLSFT